MSDILVGFIDLSVTDVTLTSLAAISRYRYLSVRQVAVIAGIRDKSASAMLLKLQRQKLLGSFGNTGIRGYGKTPKLYYLTKRGHGLLASEYAEQGREVATYRAIKISSRWSPLMYHRIATLDALAYLERDCKALQDYALVDTLVEYRREQVGADWRKETTDYVSDMLTPENKIVPDAGFVLENRKSGKRALFLIEVDCGTMRLTTSKPALSPQTIVHKLAQYDRYLASGRVAKRYPKLGEFAGFHLLFITDSAARVANVRQAAASLSQDFHPYYRLSTQNDIAKQFLHDGWLSRDHADHKTYPLINGE